MSVRFTLDPPLTENDHSCTTGPWRQRQPFVKVWEAPTASSGSWPSRQAPTFERRQADIELIFRANMARRDAAVKDYGEPETAHEFYAGRPGSQAEKIVLDCLRKLEAIPNQDRRYATILTAAISHAYIETSCDDATAQRRAMQLLRISGESA